MPPSVEQQGPLSTQKNIVGIRNDAVLKYNASTAGPLKNLVINENFIRQRERPKYNIPLYISLKDYSVIISRRDEWRSYDLSTTPSGFVCYTDGSRIGADAGCGYYIAKRAEKSKKETKIHADSFFLGNKQVFDSEIIAISKAASYLTSLGITGENITIFSDCQSVLRELAQPSKEDSSKFELVVECQEELSKLAKARNTIVLVWIPAHCGFNGNEKADWLAKKAVRNGRKQNVIKLNLMTETKVTVTEATDDCKTQFRQLMELAFNVTTLVVVEN